MTTSSTWPTHLLRVSDLTCVSLAELLALAARMNDDPEGWSDVLSGQSVACVLGGASADGRLAAEGAVPRLGMAPVALEPGELALGVREALADTARTLSTYASAVVVRNLAHELLRRLARASSVPVINADSPGHHPCQALADL